MIGKEFLKKTTYPYLGPSDQVKGLPQPPLQSAAGREQTLIDLPEPQDTPRRQLSLAAAIDYPDFFYVFAGTTLNQTGQAIEIIAVTMAVYLTISLLTALFMNWYNRAVALKGN